MFDPDMLFRIPALLVALTVHEYAHARVAVAMGDPTPKFLGRLTLNPIAHLDPVGLLMLWIFKFGWAKPVPINPNNFREGRKAMVLVSFAGPGSNIAVAFITAFVYALIAKFFAVSPAVRLTLQMLYSYNILFAIFNLVPIPPLDGSKILMSLLPGPLAYSYQRIEPYGTFILMGLVYIGVIGSIIYPIQAGLSYIINQIVAVIFY